MAQTRLQRIDLPEPEAENSPPVSRETPRAESVFTSLLAISLSALSQRALVAVAGLVDLALIASAFVLWLDVIREPSVLQLVGVGMYAAFIILCVYMRHK